MSRLRVALLPLLTATALASCGSSQSEVTVDAASLRLTSTDGQRVPVTAPACDDVEKPEVGTKLACTARNPAGSKLEIAAEVASIDGSKARITGSVTRALVDGTAIAAQLKQALAAQDGAPEPEAVSCPDEIAVPTTSPARCQVTAGAASAPITVTIDAQGELTYDVGSDG